MKSQRPLIVGRKRLVLTALGFVAAMVLVACSAAQMIYSQMPRIAAAKLDDAFDLRQDQKRMVRSELDRMLVWHRRDQIPRLVDWTLRVEESLQSGNGFSKEEILDLTDSLLTFRDALYDYVYANSSVFLASLDAGQIDYFSKFLAKSNKERFADLDKGPEAYAKIKTKQWQSRFEDWTGDLNEQQMELLAAAARGAHEQDVAMREISLARQTDFLRLLKIRPAAETDDLAATLWKLTPAWKNTPRFERGLQVLVAVGTTLSTKQKEHLAKQIKVWQGRLGAVALVASAP